MSKKPAWIDLRGEAYCIERKLSKDQAPVYADGFREAKRMIADMIEEDFNNPQIAILVRAVGEAKKGEGVLENE